MKKLSATKKEILVGLSQEILNRAASLTVIANFERKIMARPLEFFVDGHTVLVKTQGSIVQPDYLITCDCKFFRYSGPEYYAYTNGHLLGNPRGSVSSPKKRDPDGINRVCKHIAAVMRDYF
jgi:hypothetical protein